MTFSYTVKVSPEDIDDLKHVNNVVYLSWILDAAGVHWVSATDEDLRKKYVWVVLSHYIEYKNPAFVSDELVIETWVDSCTATYCERHTLIKNKHTGKTIVKALTKWCPISTVTHRPT